MPSLVGSGALSIELKATKPSPLVAGNLKKPSIEPVPDEFTPMEYSPNGRYLRYNNLLGRGACKRVYKGLDTEEGIEIAWNQVELIGGDMDEDTKMHLFEEIHVLQNLKHKNIISFYDWWYDPRTRTISFITELFTSGTLRQHRRRMKVLSEHALKRWIYQVVEGLLYLHGHSPPIVHRDLKCDNIFINSACGTVKIGDLGLATARSGMSVVGTPEFMAPEVYDELYDEKVDIYSLGMCLLELTIMEYPYSECHSLPQIFKKVTMGVLPQGLSKVTLPAVKSLIEACIRFDPEARPSARDLIKHPWFDSIRAESSSLLSAIEHSPSPRHHLGGEGGAEGRGEDDQDDGGRGGGGGGRRREGKGKKHGEGGSSPLMHPSLPTPLRHHPNPLRSSNDNHHNGNANDGYSNGREDVGITNRRDGRPEINETTNPVASCSLPFFPNPDLVVQGSFSPLPTPDFPLSRPFLGVAAVANVSSSSPYFPPPNFSPPSHFSSPPSSHFSPSPPSVSSPCSVRVVTTSPSERGDLRLQLFVHESARRHHLQSHSDHGPDYPPDHHPEDHPYDPTDKSFNQMIGHDDDGDDPHHDHPYDLANHHHHHHHHHHPHSPNHHPHSPNHPSHHTRFHLIKSQIIFPSGRIETITYEGESEGMIGGGRGEGGERWRGTAEGTERVDETKEVKGEMESEEVKEIKRGETREITEEESREIEREESRKMKREESRKMKREESKKVEREETREIKRDESKKEKRFETNNETIKDSISLHRTQNDSLGIQNNDKGITEFENASCPAPSALPSSFSSSSQLLPPLYRALSHAALTGGSNTVQVLKSAMSSRVNSTFLNIILSSNNNAGGSNANVVNDAQNADICKDMDWDNQRVSPSTTVGDMDGSLEPNTANPQVDHSTKNTSADPKDNVLTNAIRNIPSSDSSNNLIAMLDPVVPYSSQPGSPPATAILLRETARERGEGAVGGVKAEGVFSHQEAVISHQEAAISHKEIISRANDANVEKTTPKITSVHSPDPDSRMDDSPGFSSHAVTPRLSPLISAPPSSSRTHISSARSIWTHRNPSYVGSKRRESDRFRSSSSRRRHSNGVSPCHSNRRGSARKEGNVNGSSLSHGCRGTNSGYCVLRDHGCPFYAGINQKERRRRHSTLEYRLDCGNNDSDNDSYFSKKRDNNDTNTNASNSNSNSNNNNNNNNNNDDDDDDDDSEEIFVPLHLVEQHLFQRRRIRRSKHHCRASAIQGSMRSGGDGSMGNGEDPNNPNNPNDPNHSKDPDHHRDSLVRIGRQLSGGSGDAKPHSGMDSYLGSYLDSDFDSDSDSDSDLDLEFGSQLYGPVPLKHPPDASLVHPRPRRFSRGNGKWDSSPPPPPPKSSHRLSPPLPPAYFSSGLSQYSPVHSPRHLHHLCHLRHLHPLRQLHSLRQVGHEGAEGESKGIQSPSSSEALRDVLSSSPLLSHSHSPLPPISFPTLDSGSKLAGEAQASPRIRPGAGSTRWSGKEGKVEEKGEAMPYKPSLVSSSIVPTQSASCSAALNTTSTSTPTSTSSFYDDPHQGEFHPSTMSFSRRIRERFLLRAQQKRMRKIAASAQVSMIALSHTSAPATSTALLINTVKGVGNRVGPSKSVATGEEEWRNEESRGTGKNAQPKKSNANNANDIITNNTKGINHDECETTLDGLVTKLEALKMIREGVKVKVTASSDSAVFPSFVESGSQDNRSKMTKELTQKNVEILQGLGGNECQRNYRHQGNQCNGSQNAHHYAQLLHNQVLRNYDSCDSNMADVALTSRQGYSPSVILHGDSAEMMPEKSRMTMLPENLLEKKAISQQRKFNRPIQGIIIRVKKGEKWGLLSSARVHSRSNSM